MKCHGAKLFIRKNTSTTLIRTMLTQAIKIFQIITTSKSRTAYPGYFFTNDN